jgi:hypothetical protein
MFRLVSLAACAAASLLAMGASFALGYGCARTRRELGSLGSEGTRSARRAAQGKTSEPSG